MQNIQYEQVKKLMLKYPTKTWVRNAKRRGFGPKLAARDPSTNRTLTQLTNSLSEPNDAQRGWFSKRRRNSLIEQHDKGEQRWNIINRISFSRKSKTAELRRPRTGTDPQPLHSWYEEEDIETASVISDQDDERSSPEIVSDDDAKVGTTEESKINDEDKEADSDEEDEFYSDSSYYSSSEDSDDEEDWNASEHEDNEEDTDVRLTKGKRKIMREDNSNYARKQRKTEEEKERKIQKMKRGPLVRLHPKTVIPVVFSWIGSATTVSSFSRGLLVVINVYSSGQAPVQVFLPTEVESSINAAQS